MIGKPPDQKTFGILAKIQLNKKIPQDKINPGQMAGGR